MRRAALLAVGLAVGLVACSRTTDVAVAPLADDPGCAEAMVDLPDAVGDAERSETTTQSTAAWGDPAITWRCGLEPLGPTTETCYSIGDVDWIATEDGDDSVFTTFGRTPTVEVRVPADAAEGRDVALATFAAGVVDFPQDRRCQSLEDLQGG